MSLNNDKNNITDYKTIKFYASKPMMAGTILLICLGYGLFLFVTIYDVARKQLFEDFLLFIILALFLIVLPTLAFIITARRWFTVIKIDKDGIKTSLFHIFYKKSFNWEEIKEIRYFEQIFPFLFISKNISLANMSYDSMIKQKDVIQVSLTRKVYEIIRTYYFKPIESLSDRKVKQLNLDK